MSVVSDDLLKIDAHVEQVTDKYLPFITLCQNRLLIALLRGNVTHRTKISFDRVAKLAGRMVINDLKTTLSVATKEISGLAAYHTGLPAIAPKQQKFLAEYLNDALADTLIYAESVLMSDIKYGLDQLRASTLRASLRLRQPPVEPCIQQNRKEWRSVTKIRLAVRQHLISVFNETTIFILSKQEVGEFTVNTLAPNRGLDGNVFAISEYEGLRLKTFHPNANALIYKISK